MQVIALFKDMLAPFVALCSSLGSASPRANPSGRYGPIAPRR